MDKAVITECGSGVSSSVSKWTSEAVIAVIVQCGSDSSM